MPKREHIRDQLNST